jgi:hypothetical protein
MAESHCDHCAHDNDDNDHDNDNNTFTRQRVSIMNCLGARWDEWPSSCSATRSAAGRPACRPNQPQPRRRVGTSARPTTTTTGQRRRLHATQIGVSNISVRSLASRPAGPKRAHQTFIFGATRRRFIKTGKAGPGPANAQCVCWCVYPNARARARPPASEMGLDRAASDGDELDFNIFLDSFRSSRLSLVFNSRVGVCVCVCVCVCVYVCVCSLVRAGCLS